jgi:hypothetical protein
MHPSQSKSNCPHKSQSTQSPVAHSSFGFSPIEESQTPSSLDGHASVTLLQVKSCAAMPLNKKIEARTKVDSTEWYGLLRTLILKEKFPNSKTLKLSVRFGSSN